MHIPLAHTRMAQVEASVNVPRALALVEEMKGRGIALQRHARDSLHKSRMQAVGAQWNHKIATVLRELKEQQRAERERE